MFKTILGATSVLLALSMPALADGDADKGERVFKKCKACHDVGAGAKNKVGPTLNGIVGAPAAHLGDEFNYSDAMLEKAAEGMIWDEETLTVYLKKPKELVPGTKMSFAGLRKDGDIENVIAYLQTFPAE
ncbi:MAG: cytochrome c family protein [Rhodobacteraceae bacterium]|nr:cytochrome c family protein [Paracoccaceae bacterium]